MSYKPDPGFLKNQNFRVRWPLLAQETVDDYVLKNEQARELSIGFKIKLPYVFLTKQDEEMFKRRDGWDIFKQTYPGSFGYITFSAIGFNPAMDRALVYVTRGCGLLCGSGHLVVLIKHGGVWDSQEWVMLWAA